MYLQKSGSYLKLSYCVAVPPQIIDKDTSTDLVVKEGSNVTLHCKAAGHPEPFVMWRREDNQEIQHNGRMGNLKLKSTSLTSNNVLVNFYSNFSKRH